MANLATKLAIFAAALTQFGGFSQISKIQVLKRQLTAPMNTTPCNHNDVIDTDNHVGSSYVYTLGCSIELPMQ